MQLGEAASFLIAPGKKLDPPPTVQGTFIGTSGRLRQMLGDVFTRSDQECQLPIRFAMSPEGEMKNPARDLIIAFCKNPTMVNGKAIAERLRDSTTNRSGLGLLFLLHGSDKKRTKLVLSRFPADQGVVAEASKGSLTVEFIERVFMKNAATYKATVYKGASYDKDFWLGSAVDKQLNMTGYQAANYWIREFLNSDFETTSKQGTKRFAVALREASRSAPNSSTKHELVGASMLAANLGGQVVTINDILNKFNLSEAARDAIISKLGYSALAGDTFVFDAEEFLAHAALASVELNTGAIMLAPPDRFNAVFSRETVVEGGDEYRFRTQGRIVDEKVRGRR